jgi:hypothetical protein
MLSSETRDKIADKSFQRMRWHLFLGGLIESTALLTPFSSMYRCWKFQGGNTRIEYTEYYIFGIRVARRRL